MSGVKPTGLRAFDFLLELRDEIASRAIVIDVDDTWPAHGVAVIEALGATARRRPGRARRGTMNSRPGTEPLGRPRR